MLSAIRTFAKSWVALILIGLLIVSFAVFGLSDVFQRGLNTWVVKAGSRTVEAAQFRQEFDNFRQQAEQQYGQPITAQEAAEAGLDDRLLDDLATREAFAAALSKAGIAPSDKLVAEQLQQIPGFFNSVSGQFDKALYQQRLAENGLNEAGFEQRVRDDIAQNHFATALVNGFVAPRAYSALGAIYGLEARDITVFPVTPRMVGEPALPTDAQLQAFMKENAARLTRPEQRILTVVRFSPDQVTANIPLTEEDVKKRYEFRKDTLSRPETRSLVQIPAKDAATASAIAARLNKGEAPQAVAKAVGVDPVVYEDKPQTAIVDHKVAAAAFALSEGQVSGAIQGDLGLAVVKVTKVTPGQTVSLEEIRPQIEAELRKDAAAEKVYELSQAYEDAHAEGASLSEAAAKAGVPAVTIGPVSAQGRGPRGEPVPGVTPKMLETAFGLSQGGESDVEEGGDGSYFAVRVERITPASLPPLAEVKPELTRAWMLREMVNRMQSRAAELAERVRKGESLEAVAASIGSRVSRTVGVDRSSARDVTTVSPDALGKAFTAKAGDVFTAQGVDFEIIVGKLEAVRQPGGPNLARLTEESRPQVTMNLFREFGEAAQRGARTLMKVRTDADRARIAIGLEPEANEEAPAAAAKGSAEKAK
jgi:peptidyl-prolyl cis-trans isomerase D